MPDTFLSDSAITDPGQDRFQRAPFAQRIADSIINSNSRDTGVIGIYGAWGEGKTSVLEMIETALAGKEQIITLKFNPWRYKDEDGLLKQFFSLLAASLNAKLQKKKEIIGEVLKEYGEYIDIDIPFIGSPGKKAKKAGEALSHISIEDLKKRVESILLENGKKIVVIIDDIDRLEKEEIHAVFRLVKLTGNFAYTTYILAFDENIVSAAIGGRFGSGDQQAGFNFLEKIIQVPAKIPLAQKFALKEYCLEKVLKVLAGNQIALSFEEREEFIFCFSSFLLPRLNTPRLAVRYANTVSFSLPLLIGEVYYVDLLLIEGVRIFYPEIHDLIRARPQYFITDVRTDAEKTTDLNGYLTQATRTYRPDEDRNIRELLDYLFRKTIPPGYAVNSSAARAEHDRRKRISSPDYFSRYFSYTVLAGEISDVKLRSILEATGSSNPAEIAASLQTLLSSSAPDRLLDRLSQQTDALDNTTALKMVEAIALMGDALKDKHAGAYAFDPVMTQAALYILNLLGKITDPYHAILTFVKRCSSFELLSKTMLCCFRLDAVPNVLGGDKAKALVRMFITRALRFAAGQPVWQTYPTEAVFLFTLWADYGLPGNLNRYVQKELEKTPSTVKSLVSAFTTPVYDLHTKQFTGGTFDDAAYRAIKKLLDPRMLYNAIWKIPEIDPADFEPGIPLQLLNWEYAQLIAFVYRYRRDQHSTKLLESAPE